VSILTSDLRYSIRSLLKSPGLTVAAILSLGLGIGANTTIFSWVQAVLLRPIPGASDPGSLVIPAMENRDGQTRAWSYPNYQDLHDRATLVDYVGQDDQTLSIVVDGTAERAWGGLVSGNFFEVMGVRAAAGRVFTRQDDVTPGGHPVMVLSYAYWQRRFAGRADIVGQQVTVNNVPVTVIGVAQEGFLGSFLGVSTAAWLPMMMQREVMGGDRLNARGNGWMQSIGRLKPGVSKAQAQAEATAIMAALESEYRAQNDGRRLRIVEPWEAPFGAATALKPILLVLSVLVVLVLVIACANVANLLLSKAVGRRREVAVRLSLGASRGRLVRQLLTESMALAVVAGTLGVVMAYWTMDVIMAFVPPIDIPIDLGLRMDQTTLLFALAVSVVTGVLFGLAPALQASKPDTIHALKEEGTRGSGGRTGQRLRNALVVAQVAVCLVMLVGAMLFLRSFREARTLSPGFEVAHAATASVDLFPSGYLGERSHDFRRRAVAAVEALPGVTSAAFTNRIPLVVGNSSSMGIGVEGYAPRENEEIVINYTVVGPRYFETLGIPLREGREFSAVETPTSPRVIIINESMARRYWPEGKALGGRIRMGENTLEVIGIAGDTKYSSLTERPTPQLFYPLAQSNASTVRLIARTSGDPAALVGGLRDAFRALDANLPVYDARTVQEHMQGALFVQRMAADLLGAMGVLALVLAAIGLYGVIAYAVNQRTQEMGIRLALGASPGSLLGMIVGQGMTLTATGLVVGLVLALGAFGSIGAMRSLLPGISPLDPVTFVAVPLVLALIALVASWIPARRAGRIDPLVALRVE
jgi:predicted permease